MNRETMHIVFRQYAQQMGMQNIRTFLPEQIDIVLNTSIVDILNQLIKEHIVGTTEKGDAYNSKLAQANSFKKLYFIDSYVEGDGLIKQKNKVNGFTRYHLSNLNDSNWFHFVGASAIFKYPIGDKVDTYKFPIRYIDEQYLSECLTDKFLQPNIKSPIMIIYNNNHIDLYTNEDENKDIKLNSIELAYIRKPKQISATQTECDMPEHLHDMIVKHAVDLYKASIGQASTQSAQQTQ